MSDPIRLSVLDTSPIVQGATPQQALRNTVDLATLADSLGYHRYWVPEHHGMRGVASTSPAVLIAHLANTTTTLRLGAGGVLLPNHAPLVIAEQFATLTALHPGRIDLGIGKAPGGRQQVINEIRPAATRTAKPFPHQLTELQTYLNPPENAPIKAIPAINGTPPPLWLLGSSPTSATLAATLGLPYAYAHHLNPTAAAEALHTYRTHFRPTPQTPAPTTLVSLAAIAAETDPQAEYLAGSIRRKVLSRHHGTRIQLPTPEEAAIHPYTAADHTHLATHSAKLLVGSPEKLTADLQAILDTTGATEIMVTTPVYRHADRRRSYELLATIIDQLHAS
ncbi:MULTISPECIES: LLM class flavin-dependent oxidoreductase [unclassified Crossiella]|uniref:LLM class flavin-dependent oxidoreductase n=1 Tax=unclassified Crossiella TaxID=2620835 RepID=UPI001FFE5337|nr:MULTISPECIES: LLM class flavin-dependent oxidoreductase [unclassified Crossiella]MCK2240870.1 LLM class flavin-dependent oxidoreductase [Crossiella sp. S99.2]MCK2253986.1 LLM class flavin-dependent oxidoreductase [Crossiella sp. S99.1]